jgi:ribosomal protein S18 acetylase RimI-like enzyme
MTVLVPMRTEVFPDAVAASIADYARQNVAAGRWPEAGALERSRSEFASLLPQGQATPDHHWLEIRAGDDGPRVGHLWFTLQERQGRRTAFVYQLEVLAAYRRQGHARRAFGALESLAREMGVASIGLHVFAFNAPAQALYRALGYEVTSLNMNKQLDGAPGDTNPRA